jgi:hypothetical protein
VEKDDEMMSDGTRDFMVDSLVYMMSLFYKNVMREKVKKAKESADVIILAASNRNGPIVRIFSKRRFF